MLQLHPQCFRVSLGCILTGLQKYILLVMNQKIQKSNLGSCHHFYIACYQPVYLAIVSGNQTRVAGRGPWCIGFPCGCSCTAPLFTTSTMYILHVDCGGVPHVRGQHLALAYYLKKIIPSCLIQYLPKTECASVSYGVVS